MRHALALLLAVASSGCAVFDAPPEVSIVGLTAGLLPDARAPIVLSFTKPPIPGTIKIEIAKYVVDSEGRLGDEPGNTLGTGLETLFTHDPVNGDTGGEDMLSPDGSTMTITPSVVPPVGGQLVVLVEPGLSPSTCRSSSSVCSTSIRPRASSRPASPRASATPT
jgi:hypothetical protein